MFQLNEVNIVLDEQARDAILKSNEIADISKQLLEAQTQSSEARAEARRLELTVSDRDAEKTELKLQLDASIRMRDFQAEELASLRAQLSLLSPPSRTEVACQTDLLQFQANHSEEGNRQRERLELQLRAANR